MSLKNEMLPPPLTAQHEGSFAYATVKDRLPVIITQIIDHLCRERIALKQCYGEESVHDVKKIVAGLSEMKNHMQTDKAIKDAIDIEEDPNENNFWHKAFDSYKAIYSKDPSWFSASWLFVEVYMYRRVHELFMQSDRLKSYDPFRHSKVKSFQSASKNIGKLLQFTSSIIQSVDSLESSLKTEYLKDLLQISLWGNQYDLCIASCSNKAQKTDLLSVLKEKREKILVWELEGACQYLENVKDDNRAIGVILDNAGFELISDLCLLTFLMEMKYCSKVILYTKIRPYFISDTTRKDITYVLDELSKNEDTTDLAMMWRQYIANGRWEIHDKAFWTAPQDFSQMEKEDSVLYNELSDCKLLMFKGDLNYRKLVGDLDWPVDTSFRNALQSFLPSSMLVLRTIKGGPVVGLDTDLEIVKKALLTTDWNISGDFGMIHFLSI